MANENVFLCYALLLGIFITFVYDLLRIFRRVISHNNVWISIEDFIFWIFCGVEVFLLMYRESNGTLRWFAVLGALAGMFLYKKTVSNFFVTYVSRALSKIIGFLLGPVRFLKKKMKSMNEHITVKKRSLRRYIRNKLTNLWKMLKMIMKKQ